MFAGMEEEDREVRRALSDVRELLGDGAQFCQCVRDVMKANSGWE
jgi:hypothetical protein